MATYDELKATQTSTVNADGTINRDALATLATASTTKLAQPQATQAIPADQLTPTQPIKVPGVSTDTSSATGMVADAEAGTKSIQEYLKEVTPPETGTSKQYGDLLSQINTLLPDLANKGKDQAAAEEQANLPNLRKDLAALNAQITSRLAGYNKQIQAAELAPGETPQRLVIGRQAVIARNQAADIGLLQARALGLQGQVQAAQETANRAIDLKYETLQHTLNVKMEQLKLIQPILDKEERQYAQALERKYVDDQRRIEEEKAKAKENIALSIEAGLTTKFVNRQGEFFRTSDGKPYSSTQEFFKDAGVKSFEEAYSRGLIGDYSPNASAERGIVADLIAKYPDSGITLADTLSSAQSKLTNSRIYQDAVRPPATGGSRGGGGSTAKVTTAVAQKYSLPTDTSKDTYNQVVDAIGQAKRELADLPYYDQWGTVVDWMKANGLNPTEWDYLLWDLLHPDGLKGKTDPDSNDRNLD